MAGIPVKDIGAMSAASFVGGVNASPQGKNAKPSSFEDVWNGQMERTGGARPADGIGKNMGSRDKNTDKDSPVENRNEARNNIRDTDHAVKDEKISDPVNDRTTKEQDPENGIPETSEIDDDVKKLEQAMEMIGTIAWELVGRISDNFDISPEEIQVNLDEMGLQHVDLLQSEILSELLLKVGEAEDVTSLLTNEILYEDYRTVMDIRNDMVEGLEKVFADMDLKQPVENMVAQAAERLAAASIGKEPVVAAETQLNTEMTETTEETSADAGLDRIVEANPVETAVGSDTNVDQKGTHSETGARHSEKHGTNDRQIPLAFHDTQFDTNAVLEQSLVSETATGEVDTQNIMRQIMDYMRVQIKPDVSDLEMQLHPASLGSVQIHVASRGGVITAQFIAQDETVKAILESQMIQLKESFSQQGVKVEAIEVSVQTNEFQRNLDQGDNRQTGEEPSRRNRTRRINLSGGVGTAELEGLEDEERITADMMAANGNSVDYMA
jgi:flagellar hook-length control protein FliK